MISIMVIIPKSSIKNHPMIGPMIEPNAAKISNVASTLPYWCGWTNLFERLSIVSQRKTNSTASTNNMISFPGYRGIMINERNSTPIITNECRIADAFCLSAILPI